MKTVFAKPASVERKWYIIDAQGLVLGRVAAKVAAIVRGKNKAIFVPHQEIGDFVVVINAEKIVVTGRKAKQKMYYHHSGYIGGLKANNFEKVIARHPTQPLEAAIKGMLPKGPLGRKMAKNVKIYAGAEHPHSAQNPITLEL
ncbi:MAG: 50S ribosomal protein L13 [Treponema sp.]|nr:50S ribosomal protein L13 [Treponema sp.]MCL2252292.1 50S ribosomal protein L13 [Treponema sp.]